MTPSRFGLAFHHFGLAVRAKEPAAAFLAGLGYELGELVYDPEQKVWLTLCRSPLLPAIELVLPGAEEGPVHRLLKRNESAIYHLCYLAPDAAKSLDAMAAEGVRLATVSTPKPALLFSGALVSFHYVEGFGLIELIHAAELAA